jgi:hypothetical protein
LVVARYEGQFRNNAGEPLSRDELLALLEPGAATASPERQAAIACYLAGGEDCGDAVKLLGGAFAADASLLTERKGD